MTGFLLLLLFGIWVALLRLIILRLMKTIKPRKLAITVSVVFSTLFMCLPVYDEILGGFEFYMVCKKEAITVLDEKDAKEKTVSIRLSKPRYIDGSYINMYEQSWSFVDVHTGKVVAKYNTFHTKTGGWLIRSLGISQNNSPLIFNGACMGNNANKIKEFKFNFETK